MSKRINKMLEYERQRDSGEFEAMPKKEALRISRELEKLERNLGGIRNMKKVPDVVFVLDTKKEHIAVTEAKKLGIPIVALVDTNCDPDLVQFVVPGNDDAMRSGSLLCRIVSDAVEEGRHIAQRKQGDTAVKRSAEDEARVAAEQVEARRQAAAQAAEREARLAAAKAQPEVQAANDPAADAPAADAAPAEAPEAAPVPDGNPVAPATPASDAGAEPTTATTTED